MAKIPNASGRFLLRIPPALHRRLQAAAARQGLSLNEYCTRRLAAGGSAAALEEGAAALVRHAAEVAGERLVAVVVYGSWARGDAGPASDVDALVVIDKGLALTRALYTKWDAEPTAWQGRTVDPHFVHPPDAGMAGGAWPEAAVDGVVLFERDLATSLALAQIRHDIAAGKLRRRVVHGQPYWVEAA